MDLIMNPAVVVLTILVGAAGQKDTAHDAKKADEVYRKISYSQSEAHQYKNFLADKLCKLNQRATQTNKKTLAKKTVGPHPIGYVLQKAILEEMDVPFEVVGYKNLFENVFNNASTLTDNERKEILDCADAVYSESVRLKLQCIINQTFKKVSEKIAEDDLGIQIEWRRQYYKYNFNVSLLHDRSAKLDYKRGTVHDYVVYLNLENDCDPKALELYYKN